jgi:hypothetical protein
MSISEICLDGDAEPPGLSLIAGTSRPDGTAAFDLAQPYGSRIRHEYEKNTSAISMRSLQTCR